ncbi:NAD(P)-dependent oxidoreductase [Limobrevibacterium gyesilva]|uniref:NAD(P)-dependent oxidoreductase n=1 Tax=Limobrevibacterium gyesilva TaxID=2991712 RepID=A0AA42CCQ3_9PROT|nr:NAD(P)-dependent oxidoreductase [Limobrevibacterium gyesilva]
MAVAIIGLGNMGLGMAATLVRSGLVPVGFDLAPKRRALAAEAGAGVAAALADAMAGSDVVVLSLPHGRAVAAAVEAFVAVAPTDAVLVDTSTLAVAETRAFAARVAASGRAFLDAPVSGGPAGAASGQLTAMVGGDAAVLARVRPVLERLAARIVHVGGAGAGQVAKLANNMLVATHLVAAAEAMRMAEAAGVPAQAVLDVVNAASGRSAATEVNLPRWILSGSFDSGFAAGLMRKDVGLALDLARDGGVAVPVLARAAETWLARSGAVGADADFNRVPAWVMEGGDG